jgi:hypothetical protein
MAQPEIIKGYNSTRKVLKKGQLVKDVIQVAENDYLALLRGTAAQETAQQIKIGNKPTNLIVDNKRGKKIDQALYSIKVHFFAAEDILKALNEAWAIMQRLMVRATGETASRLEVWQGRYNKKPVRVGSNPAAVSISSLAPYIGTYIVGPMAPNTRKFRWLTTGKRTFRASRRKELNGLKAREKPKVPHSIHEMTIRIMKQRYPQLIFADAWVDTYNLTPGARSKRTTVNRVPTIAIWARSKGGI